MVGTSRLGRAEAFADVAGFAAFVLWSRKAGIFLMSGMILPKDEWEMMTNFSTFVLQFDTVKA